MKCIFAIGHARSPIVLQYTPNLLPWKELSSLTNSFMKVYKKETRKPSLSSPKPRRKKRPEKPASHPLNQGGKRKQM
jgi:hypothetical protein